MSGDNNPSQGLKMLVGAFSILHEKPYGWDSARKQLTYSNYKTFIELDGKKLPSHVKIASEKALKCIIEDDLNKLPSFCKVKFHFWNSHILYFLVQHDRPVKKL